MCLYNIYSNSTVIWWYCIIYSNTQNDNDGAVVPDFWDRDGSGPGAWLVTNKVSISNQSSITI